MLEDMREAFDRIYLENTWGEGSGPGSDPVTASNYLAWLRAMLCTSDSVLDVGCGDGRLASVWAPWCARYTGMDVSLVALQKARQRLPRSFRLLSGTPGDLGPEDVFDVAVVKDVIQHLPEADAAKLLADTQARVRRTVLVVGDYAREKSADILPGEYRPLNPSDLVPEAPLAASWIFGEHLKAAWVLPGGLRQPRRSPGTLLRTRP